MNNRLTRFFPFLAWWPLPFITVRADLIAGITGALVLVPKAMAYAQLSGLPVYFGLYTAFVPPSWGRCGVRRGNWRPARWRSFR